jgi:hypothetical protein
MGDVLPSATAIGGSGAKIFFGDIYLTDHTILWGAGTVDNYLTSSQLNATENGANFLQFRLKHTASTAGATVRGMYLRFHIAPTASAAVTGEALRVYTDVTNVAVETVHGAHIGLAFGTSGRITGLAAAVRGTLMVPTTATSFGGTVCALMGEIWFDSSTSTLANCQHAALRIGFTGDATAVAAATGTNYISFIGSNATNYKSGTLSGGPKGLRVLVDGVVGYIPIYTACA